MEVGDRMPVASSDSSVEVVAEKRLLKGQGAGTANLTAGTAAPVTVSVSDEAIQATALHLVVPASIRLSLSDGDLTGAEEAIGMTASVRSVFTTIPQAPPGPVARSFSS